MTYLNLVAKHRRLLAFGFSLTFFSSFGQTFFIALFGAEIRGEFGLTHGSFGGLYALATLASGSCLIWLGSAIDRVRLRVYARMVVLGLVAACVLFASARGAILLVFAIFTLRLFGQGLMGHTAMTTMARFFTSSRGKAMSIAALGFPVGEAILPRAFVEIKGAVGWRPSWVIVAVALAVVLVPSVEWLLRKAVRGEETDSTRPSDGGESPDDGPGASESSRAVGSQREWNRRAVARDPRFYFVLPAVLAPPFIATGIFFHQIVLVETKGWTLELFAASFAAYAATQLGASLVSGPLVDRIGAARIMPVYLIPLGVALAFLALGHAPWCAVAFMLAAGMSGGAQGTVVGAYWAEVYGVRHLGAIRSLVMALMVFSTAAAPILLGRMIDGGVTMEAIAWMALGYVAVASVLAGLGERRSA